MGHLTHEEFNKLMTGKQQKSAQGAHHHRAECECEICYPLAKSPITCRMCGDSASDHGPLGRCMKGPQLTFFMPSTSPGDIEYDALTQLDKKLSEEGLKINPQQVCRICNSLFPSNLRYCPKCSPPGARAEDEVFLVDVVNHPAHYGGDTVYEAKKVIRAWDLTYNMGSAAAYICRAGKKDGNSNIQDLRKAVWHIQDEITHLENNG